MSTLNKGKYLLGILLLTLSFTARAQTSSVSITPGGPVVCAGTTLSASVNNLLPPYTYLWSNGATTSTITLNTSGFIRVTVVGFRPNGSTRRISSRFTPYIVIPRPNASVSPTGPIRLCPGQTTTLSASGGQFLSTYLWSTGQTTRNISVNSTGNYSVTITHSFLSCTTSSTSNSVNVGVLGAGFTPAITADGPTTVCKPGIVALHADTGYTSYQWSTGATTQAVNILMDGSQQGAVLDTLSVTLTVELNGQCSFTNTDGIVLRSVRQPKLRAQDCDRLDFTLNDSIRSELVLTFLNQVPEFEFEFEETSNPNITWTYVSNNRWCPLNQVSPALQPMKFYNVRVRAIIDGIPYCYGNNCLISIVPATPMLTPTSNRLASSNSTINARVFPNPSSSDFQLSLDGLNTDQQATVQVADMSGRLVDNFIVDPSAGSVRFGTNLTTGIYLVTIRQGDNITSTRVVKTNP
jgi:hypothetical protein